MIILRNFFLAMVFIHFLRAQMLNLTGLQALIANILSVVTILGACYLGNYKELILFEIAVSGLFVLYLFFIGSSIIIKEAEWFKMLIWFILFIFAFPYGNREYKEMIEQEKQISDKQQSDITKEDELK